LSLQNTEAQNKSSCNSDGSNTEEEEEEEEEEIIIIIRCYRNAVKKQI
jgi:hypothetical protein